MAKAAMEVLDKIKVAGVVRPLAEGAWQPRHDVMSMSLDRHLINELSNLVTMSFEVFPSAVDGQIMAQASADVGPKMANVGVEKYIVPVMIPTISDNVIFTD